MTTYRVNTQKLSDPICYNNLMTETKVRTRFAPSPTGALHAGTVRTALFAWLTARQAGGTFILRIEDTDQAREVDGAIENIVESLRYLGIDWQEGLEIGGDYGPYIQSQRLHIYKEWADKLANKGLAYPDPYTPEELESFRAQARNEKRPFLFRHHRPDNPPKWDGTKALRLKSNPREYSWHDEVMGDLSAGPDAVDDFIIMKADGFPTYNFCHIIDDYLMKITHVIRSQEFISSMPRFLNLYEALEIDAPVFATVPNVLGPDGNKKLSKRDGAKQIIEYKNEGYPPEALMNFLATLGWNDGTEQEIFSPKELIDKFDLKRVQRSGARFDERRLLWLSGAHIRNMEIDDLYNRVEEFWPESASEASDSYKKEVLILVKERLKFYAELPSLTKFFFEDLPVDDNLISEHKQLKKYSKEQLKTLLQVSRTALEKPKWEPQEIQDVLNELIETTGEKPVCLFGLIRIAISQNPSSPALNDTLALLGKDKSLRRIDEQLSEFA